MNGEVEVKVRDSLTEKAFRKYEEWIAGAVKGSIFADPAKLPNAMKQSSFAVGLREAIRGVKKYNYNSKGIPVGFDLNKLKVLELADGRVMIQNAYEDRMGREKAKEDIMTLHVDVNGNIVARNQLTPILKEDIRLMPELEVEEVQKWCEELMTCPTWRNHFAWLMRTSSEAEVEFLQEIKKHYSGLDVEKLDHGWWRLYR